MSLKKTSNKGSRVISGQVNNIYYFSIVFFNLVGFDCNLTFYGLATPSCKTVNSWVGSYYPNYNLTND